MMTCSKPGLLFFVTAAWFAGGGSAQAQGSAVAAGSPAGSAAVSVAEALNAASDQGLGYTAAAVKSDLAAIPPEVQILRSIEKEIREKYRERIADPSDIPSMVFTPSQHALLREARIGFNTRLPTLQELRDVPNPDDPNYRPPPALRELALGGIVFYSPDDWTIWLNKKRVTPGAMPAEAVDLRVYKDFIELRWFDSVTNQVYPIRLRPNQRFNIDGRVFLPG